MHKYSLAPADLRDSKEADLEVTRTVDNIYRTWGLNLSRPLITSQRNIFRRVGRRHDWDPPVTAQLACLSDLSPPRALPYLPYLDKQMSPFKGRWPRFHWKYNRTNDVFSKWIRLITTKSSELQSCPSNLFASRQGKTQTQSGATAWYQHLDIPWNHFHASRKSSSIIWDKHRKLIYQQESDYTFSVKLRDC